MKAIIYCNPNSIFALRQAQFYAKKGIDFWIITYHPFKEYNPDAYDLIISRDRIINIRKSHRYLNKAYRLIKTAYRRLLRMEFDKNQNLRKRLDIKISDLILKKIKPDFVFGHHLLSYGNLVANAPSYIRRIVMPYGGDIYRIDKKDKRFPRLVKNLNKIDLFVPSAEYAKELMLEKFSIPPHKIKPISWGVELARFEGKDKKTSRMIVLEHLGIDVNDNRKIVLNIRRFRPAWGSVEVFEAMKLLSDRNIEFIGILVGGYKNDTEYHKNAQEEIRINSCYSSKIHFLEYHVEQDLFNHIINSSDIILSILKVEDMRSSSILEGIAVSAIPVISRCKEYSYMEKHGFKALYTSLDVKEIADKIEMALNYTDTNSLFEANRNYLTIHESMEIQQEKLYEVSIPN